MQYCHLIRIFFRFNFLTTQLKWESCLNERIRNFEPHTSLAERPCLPLWPWRRGRQTVVKVTSSCASSPGLSGALSERPTESVIDRVFALEVRIKISWWWEETARFWRLQLSFVPRMNRKREIYYPVRAVWGGRSVGAARVGGTGCRAGLPYFTTWVGLVRKEKVI